MVQVFYSGYEISILGEIQNAIRQALTTLIQLVELCEEARPDVTSRGPFQPKLFCDYICFQY